MKKQKSKKRLSLAALVFLLTFITGSAFAFGTGELDIVGTVTVDVPLVVWYSVDTDFTSSDDIYHNAEIVDARGRVDQRIIWTVDFSGEGPPTVAGPEGAIMPFDIFDIWDTDMHVTLMATAMNESNFDVEILFVDVEWSDPVLAAALGLSYYVDDMMFVGPVLAGTETMSLMVGMGWTADDMDVEDLLDDLAEGESLDMSVDITITFEYVPA